MQIRLVDLRFTRRADRADDFAFGDAVAGIDRKRAEMKKRYGIAVGRPDRHRAAVHGQRARKGHAPACRRSHRRA
jgi:hypothetical protein